MRWPRSIPGTPYRGDQAFLNHFRTSGHCELCQKQCHLREPHHIMARGTGSHKQIDLPINIIALGAKMLCSCHTVVHTGSSGIGADDIRFSLLSKVILREALVFETPASLWAVLQRFSALPPWTTDDELDELDLLKWTKHHYQPFSFMTLDD